MAFAIAKPIFVKLAIFLLAAWRGAFLRGAAFQTAF
jgi:hypothetical protein